MAKAKEAKGIKDVNDQLREWVRKGVKPGEQVRKVEAWLKAAEPYIIYWAHEVGEIENLSEKTEALNEFFRDGIAKLSAEDRAGFREAVCDALQIRSTQWNDRLKNLDGQKRKKGKDEDEEFIFTAGGWIHHHLVELFYREDERKTYLAVRYPSGEISDLVERIVIDGQKYLPIPPNSTITKRTVLLPSELGEEMSEDELLFITKRHITTYFDFGGNDFFEEFSPLYVPFSYVYDGFMEVSYLRALGDYGTGKTRFLKSVGKICYRPIYMGGGSSAASIYSLLDVYHGTLVLNEADFRESDEASIISKILNGGTERGESVTKMRGGMENMTVESFDVFGPKVIATRKDYDDRAIRSRCITMEMVPMMPHPKIPQSLPPKKELQDLRIRNLWMRFRMMNAQENVEVDESKRDNSIEPRLNQITLGLLTTIKNDETKERIRNFLREYNETTRAERSETFTAKVLEGIMLAWAWGPVSERLEDKERIYFKDIALATNYAIDEQNRQMGETDDEEDEKTVTDEKSKKQKRSIKVKARKLTGIFKDYLNLKSIKATDGLPNYKGTKYLNMTKEMLRIKSLCERWGVAWLEVGSMDMSVELQEKCLDAKITWRKGGKAAELMMKTFDLNITSPGLTKLRDEWKGMEPHVPFEDQDPYRQEDKDE